MKNTQHY